MYADLSFLTVCYFCVIFVATFLMQQFPHIYWFFSGVAP